MKHAFLILVPAATAKTPERAVELARLDKDCGKQPGFKVLDDPAAKVRDQIEGKLVRVMENAGLYPDRVRQYQKNLEDFDGRMALSEDLAAVHGMLDHGDARIDNQRFLGVRLCGPKWAVFGYRWEP